MFGLSLIPAVFGLALPGGLATAKSVSLDFPDIFVATLPWTASVAAVAFVWLVAGSGDMKNMTAGIISIVILFVAAALAPALGPEFEVTPDQSNQAQYLLLAQENPALVARADQAAESHPRATALAALVLLVGATLLFVVLAYGTLYGGALWLAGLVCGGYVGWLLYDAWLSRDSIRT